MIDEDGAQHTRGDGEEVRPVVPGRARLPLREAHVRFVDECGRLERVARPLALELARGDPAQLGVDHFDQPRQGRRVAAGPVVQQTRDVAGSF